MKKKKFILFAVSAASFYSSAYGFDEDTLLACPSIDWNPSEETTITSRGSTTAVSAIDRTSSDNKGWFSCRVMVIGKPKTLLCKPQKNTGRQTTMVVAQGMLIDHPGDKDGVKINNGEFVHLVDNNMGLRVTLVQKGSKDGSQKMVPMAESTTLYRGSVFEFTFFGKDKLRDPSNEDAPCDVGDVLRISGVTHWLVRGDKPSEYTGRYAFFQKFDVMAAEHKARIWDMENFQSHVFSTALNWLPSTQPPRFVRMRIADGVDYGALAKKNRDKKAEKAKGAPQPADAEDVKPKERFLSKKELVLPTEEDGYHPGEAIASIDDKRDAGDSALEPASQAFKSKNSDIYVPVHIVDSRVVRYLTIVGFSITGYICETKGAMRVDPTNRDFFRKQRKIEVKAGEPAPDPNAPPVYDPYFRFGKRVVQRMPKGSPVPIQNVHFDVSMFSETLRYYGICDPQSQMEVLPFLIACTPAVVRTWINGAMSAQRSTDDDPHTFCYVLSATTKKFVKMGGKEKTLPQVGLIADVACGVVSAGYEVTHKAACELLDVLGKRQAYSAVTDKVQRQVAADMANPRIKNMYQKGKNENPINAVVQDPPVLNCCESSVNWVNYGGDYHFYVVSNYAEKNFAKYPDLLKCLSVTPHSKKPEFFSMVFLQLAKTGQLDDPKLVDLFGPPHNTEYRCGDEGSVRPVPIGDRPKDVPFQYVVFAIRKDYATKRGFDNYHGDNAFRDVVCQCESYLEQWSAAIAEKQALLKKADEEAAAKEKEEAAKNPKRKEEGETNEAEAPPKKSKDDASVHTPEHPMAEKEEEKDDEEDEEENEDDYS